MALVAGQVQTSGYKIPDYSGAAAAGGAAGASPFNVVSGLVDQYAKNKKEESQINVAKKTAASRIDSMLNLYGDKIPGLKDQLQSYKSILSDTKMSQYEQGLTAASLIQELDNLINMNIQASQYGIQQLKMQQMQQSAAGSSGGGTDLFSDG